MRKIYLAHSISTRGEFEDSKRVANEIRAIGYDVYVASENNSINDKSNDPEPSDIYEGDVSEIMSADIFVVNINGNLQDGTISEIGFVAGYNEVRMEIEEEKIFDDFVGNTPSYLSSEFIPIIAYTSNARLLQPQFYEGIPSASANHLVLGMIECWGGFCGDEEAMLSRLKRLEAMRK